jgi:hypothetical protein
MGSIVNGQVSAPVTGDFPARVRSEGRTGAEWGGRGVQEGRSDVILALALGLVIERQAERFPAWRG